MIAINVLVAALFLHAPVRGDSPPPSEQEIEAQIKVLQKQLEELRVKQDQLRKALDDAKGRPIGGIKAEVIGIVKWDGKEGGHYILTRSAGGQETRVWLMYPEDKVTGRKLEGLMGKEVIASGPLLQLPEGTTAFVPARGIYLAGFTVDEVPSKKVK